MAYENFKNMIDEYKKAKENFQNQMKNCFKEIFKEFFENYPEIQAVGWNQYTPYFNDGDTCEFSVHGIEFADQNVNLEDINSAYDLEESEFGYVTKPSDYWFEKAYNQGDTYAKEIVDEYNKACQNPRYKEVCEGITELSTILTSIPDDIYQNTFGDHVFVLATKNGIEVNEYDHE